jgi:hypothetical protein
MEYLTDIPATVADYGLCKTLAVRREVIHLKHIQTEIFIRKSFDINKHLEMLDLSLFDYMEYMTNRMRHIHHFDREYKPNPNDIVKADKTRFFPMIEHLEGLNRVIVLDFDGVVTCSKFQKLYELCKERCKTVICSANPTITKEWFEKRNLSLPDQIYSMKGKNKKIRKLMDIQERYDYVFYIDNETEYLDYAWMFGIQTFHWDGKEIKYYSKKTK